ncbi:hypothetical protein D3C86_1607260 [compost metagenome]
MDLLFSLMVQMADRIYPACIAQIQSIALTVEVYEALIWIAIVLSMVHILDLQIGDIHDRSSEFRKGHFCDMRRVFGAGADAPCERC